MEMCKARRKKPVHTGGEIYQLRDLHGRLLRGAAWNFKHSCYPQWYSPISKEDSRSQRPVTVRPKRNDQSTPHSGSMAQVRRLEILLAIVKIGKEEHEPGQHYSTLLDPKT